MCRYKARRIQEDALGLEELIATCEAEECGEGVARGEQCDDEDGQHGLADLELRHLCI
jgi:hypothetical protein